MYYAMTDCEIAGSFTQIRGTAESGSAFIAAGAVSATYLREAPVPSSVFLNWFLHIWLMWGIMIHISGKKCNLVVYIRGLGLVLRIGRGRPLIREAGSYGIHR